MPLVPGCDKMKGYFTMSVDCTTKERICHKCTVSKSLTAFRKHRYGVDGYGTLCTQCFSDACKWDDDKRKRYNMPPRCADKFRLIANTHNAHCRRIRINGELYGHELEELWNKCNGKCQACGSTHDVEFDHVISKHHGGTNYIDNIQLLCKMCNGFKGRWAIDFRCTPCKIYDTPWTNRQFKMA